MCTDGTLERVMQAEKDGYDAVFISCNLDSLVKSLCRSN